MNAQELLEKYGSPAKSEDNAPKALSAEELLKKYAPAQATSATQQAGAPPVVPVAMLPAHRQEKPGPSVPGMAMNFLRKVDDNMRNAQTIAEPALPRGGRPYGPGINQNLDLEADPMAAYKQAADHGQKPAQAQPTEGVGQEPVRLPGEQNVGIGAKMGAKNVVADAARVATLTDKLLQSRGGDASVRAAGAINPMAGAILGAAQAGSLKVLGTLLQKASKGMELQPQEIDYIAKHGSVVDKVEQGLGQALPDMAEILALSLIPGVPGGGMALQGAIRGAAEGEVGGDPNNIDPAKAAAGAAKGAITGAALAQTLHLMSPLRTVSRAVGNFLIGAGTAAVGGSRDIKDIVSAGIVQAGLGIPGRGTYTGREAAKGAVEAWRGPAATEATGPATAGRSGPLVGPQVGGGELAPPPDVAPVRVIKSAQRAMDVHQAGELLNQMVEKGAITPGQAVKGAELAGVPHDAPLVKQWKGAAEDVLLPDVNAQLTGREPTVPQERGPNREQRRAGVEAGMLPPRPAGYDPSKSFDAQPTHIIDVEGGQEKPRPVEKVPDAQVVSATTLETTPREIKTGPQARELEDVKTGRKPKEPLPDEGLDPTDEHPAGPDLMDRTAYDARLKADEYRAAGDMANANYWASVADHVAMERAKRTKEGVVKVERESTGKPPLPPAPEPTPEVGPPKLVTPGQSGLTTQFKTLEGDQIPESLRDKPVPPFTASSSNISEEPLSLEKALGNFDTPEHKAVEERGRKAAEEIGIKIDSIRNALGVWNDGRENATITRFPHGTKMEDMEFVAAKESTTGDPNTAQKAFLVWDNVEEAGHKDSATGFSVTVPDGISVKELADIHNEVAPDLFHSIVFGEDGKTPEYLLIAVRDEFGADVLDYSSRSAKLIAKAIGGEYAATRGKAKFVGADTRPEAHVVYRNVTLSHPRATPEPVLPANGDHGVAEPPAPAAPEPAAEEVAPPKRTLRKKRGDDPNQGRLFAYIPGVPTEQMVNHVAEFAKKKFGDNKYIEAALKEAGASSLLGRDRLANTDRVDVVNALNEQGRRLRGKILYDRLAEHGASKAAAIKRFVATAAVQFAREVAERRLSPEWYKTVAEMGQREAARTIPELADPHKYDTFTLINAIISPGVTPDLQVRQSFSIYRALVNGIRHPETGEVLAEPGRFHPLNHESPVEVSDQYPHGYRGYSGATVASAMVKAQKVWDYVGGSHEALSQFLRAETTKGELRNTAREIGLDPGVVKGDAVAPAVGTDLFGPKVTEYFHNIGGDRSRATLDVWATRNWRRAQGQQLSSDENAEEAPLPGERPLMVEAHQKLTDLLNEAGFKHEDGTPLQVADVQAALWSYEQHHWGSDPKNMMDELRRQGDIAEGLVQPTNKRIGKPVERPPLLPLPKNYTAIKGKAYDTDSPFVKSYVESKASTELKNKGKKTKAEVKQIMDATHSTMGSFPGNIGEDMWNWFQNHVSEGRKQDEKAKAEENPEEQGKPGTIPRGLTVPVGHNMIKDKRGVPVFAAARRMVGAYEYGIAESQHHVAEMDKILPTEALREDWAKLVIDEGGMTQELKAPGAPHNFDRLPFKERADILAKPEIRKALDYYRDVALPIGQSYAQDAGIHTLINGPLNMYVPAVSRAKAMEAVKVARNTPSKYAFGKSLQARKRTGKSESGYTGDYRATMPVLFGGRIHAAEKNRMHEETIKLGVPAEQGDPGSFMWHGKRVESKMHHIVGTWATPDGNGGHTTSFASRAFYLPQPVADFLSSVKNGPSDLSSDYNWVVRQATGLQVLGFAEPFMHTVNLHAAVSSMPNIGAVAGGPWKTLAKIPAPLDIFKNMALLADLRAVDPEKGALSLIQYATGRHSYLRPDDSGWLDHMANSDNPIISALGKPLAYPKNAVFGKGGLETRYRLVMDRLLELEQPGMDPAERANTVDNMMGTYNSNLAPALVRPLRAWGVDPFASAGVALGKTAMRSMFGFSPAGFRAYTAIQPLMAYGMSWWMLNTLFDPEHKTPLQRNTPLDKIVIGRYTMPNGRDRTISVPATLTLPGTYRALRQSGLLSMGRAFARGERSAGGLFKAWGNGVASSLVARTGLLYRTFIKATSGKDTFLDDDGDFVQEIYSTSNGDYDLKRNFTHAFEGLFPPLEAWNHNNEALQQAPKSWWWISRGGGIFGMRTAVQNAMESDDADLMHENALKGTADDTGKQLARKARRMDSDAGMDWLNEELDRMDEAGVERMDVVRASAYRHLGMSPPRRRR